MISKKTKILVVDDDVTITELVKMYLERDGYDVIAAYDGTEALRLAREEHPDLLVLDVMLPGVDGLQVCRTVRTESAVPVIMLTALSTEDDRLAGLDLGADDYITKPFSPREVAARVRAVLRRAPAESGARNEDKITHGDLTIDFLKHKVYLAGKSLELTSIEFKLLSILAQEPDRVFTRAQLIEKALGDDFEGFDRTVDVHIHNIRSKLEIDPLRPKYVRTVYGAGYKFVVNGE